MVLEVQELSREEGKQQTVLEITEPLSGEFREPLHEGMTPPSSTTYRVTDKSSHVGFPVGAGDWNLGLSARGRCFTHWPIFPAPKSLCCKQVYNFVWSGIHSAMVIRPQVGYANIQLENGANTGLS